MRDTCARQDAVEGVWIGGGRKSSRRCSQRMTAICNTFADLRLAKTKCTHFRWHLFFCALTSVRSKLDVLTPRQSQPRSCFLYSWLKLGSGVGWYQPGKWILPTRGSLGAIERPKESSECIERCFARVSASLSFAYFYY